MGYPVMSAERTKLSFVRLTGAAETLDSVDEQLESLEVDDPWPPLAEVLCGDGGL